MPRSKPVFRWGHEQNLVVWANFAKVACSAGAAYQGRSGTDILHSSGPTPLLIVARTRKQESENGEFVVVTSLTNHTASRVKMPDDLKRGDERWTEEDTYILDPGRFAIAPLSAIVKLDRSIRRSRGVDQMQASVSPVGGSWVCAQLLGSLSQGTEWFGDFGLEDLAYELLEDRARLWQRTHSKTVELYPWLPPDSGNAYYETEFQRALGDVLKAVQDVVYPSPLREVVPDLFEHGITLDPPPDSGQFAWSILGHGYVEIRVPKDKREVVGDEVIAIPFDSWQMGAERLRATFAHLL